MLEKPKLVRPVVASNCSPVTPVSAPVASVDALLQEARKTADAKGEKTGAAQPPECHAARLEAQLFETGLVLPAAAKSASATLDADPNVIVEFDSENAGISEKDRKAVIAAIAAQAKAGRRLVRIYAGRGGDGNIFERAAIADRRAKLVKRLFPAGMVNLVEFDPLQADDTVRVEFILHS
jgi:hypothetical protein